MIQTKSKRNAPKTEVVFNMTPVQLPTSIPSFLRNDTCLILGSKYCYGRQNIYINLFSKIAKGKATQVFNK